MKWQDAKQAVQADVYWQDAKIGSLQRNATGATFTYLTLLPEALSARRGATFHLPFNGSPFAVAGVNLHAYFAGLLPEGLRLKVLTRRLKTSEDDLFSLLLASGTDVIGDIAVVASGAPLQESAPAVDAVDLAKADFEKLFAQSLNPASAGPDGAESQIPGMQNKISAAMLSFPLRTKSTARRYILKLNPADQPTLVVNEHFFMRMAAACGLETANVELVRDGSGHPGLLVERFDRVPQRDAATAMIKIHVEDACQFLNRYPADKYRITFSEIAGGFAQWCDTPLIEIAKLLRLQAFSYVIGNGDMHAKNVSLMINPNTRRVEMTPAYDILSTIPYGDMKMAQHFDGRDDNLKRKYFLEFGQRFGVTAKALSALIDRMLKKAEPWLGRVSEIGLDAKRTRQLTTLMRKRWSDLKG